MFGWKADEDVNKACGFCYNKLRFTACHAIMAEGQRFTCGCRKIRIFCKQQGV